MTWSNSFFISMLSGALGLVCGGFIMNLCVDWYRVSSFEGKAGFAVVGVALLGGIAGLVIGLVASRMVATGVNPAFLKGLGYGCGAVLAFALAAIILCRLGADIAPTLDGKDRELAIEIRCPENFPSPKEFDATGAYAEVYLRGARYLPSGRLRLDEATQSEGRWIIPATIPLDTSSSNKFVRARFDDNQRPLFSLPLRSHPKRADLEWSKWVDSGWDVGTTQPPPESRFNMRYRVLRIEPESTNTSEPEQPSIQLPESSDPLNDFLFFLNQDVPEDQKSLARMAVEDRQEELAQLIRSNDPEARELALRAIVQMQRIRPLISQALLAEAASLAEGIRNFNEMPEDDPRFLTLQEELRSRFFQPLEAGVVDYFPSTRPGWSSSRAGNPRPGPKARPRNRHA